jgi:uncharacterized delta-60 repeat protein
MIGKFIAPAGAGTPSPKGIYIAGNFNNVVYDPNSYSFANLGLLNSDFTYDPSFKPFFNSGITTSSLINSIIEQPDGKILVAGSFTLYKNFTTVSRALRLNSDLTLDAGFVTANGINVAPVTMALQSDGKVLLGGFFTTHGVTSYNRIVRLNSNGSLDTSFVIGTGFSEVVRDIKIQSDGKILVGGNFTSYNGTSANRLIRLNIDGSIDSSFNIGTGFPSTVRKIKIQSDGKILVAGDFISFNGSSATSRQRCTRLNIDGSFDTAYIRTDSIAGAILDVDLLSNGDIIVAGTAGSNPPITVKRYSSSGVLNTSFQQVGMQTGASSNDVVTSIEILPDDKIILTGSFTAYNGRVTQNIVQINSDGTIFKVLPFQLNFQGFGSMHMDRCKVLSTGKIMIGGSRKIVSNFTSMQYFPNILKLNTYNNVNFSDIKSQQTLSLFPGGEIKLAVTKNGERYIGFAEVNSEGNFLRKFNSDGSFQFGFNGVSSITNGIVRDMLILPDDSMILGGAFTSYKGFMLSNNGKIIKEDSNGVVDSNFVTNIGTGFNLDVRSLALGNGGKIYVGGGYSSLNGNVGIRGLTRLNQNGTVDTSYTNSVTWGMISNIGPVKIIELSDGKILATGAFSSVGGFGRNGIVRLNSNSTVDTAFSTGTGFASLTSTVFPRSMTVQSSGKIVVVGEFFSYNGVNATRIIRLNTDGSVDNTFNSGIGFNATARDIASLPDGKMIVVGDFNNYNDNNIDGYCVLDVDGGFIETGIRLNSSASSIFIRE